MRHNATTLLYAKFSTPCDGLPEPARRSDFCRVICRRLRRHINNQERWIKVGIFEAMVSDLCEILRITAECTATPSAVIFDSHTLHTPESGVPAQYDGAKRRKGSKRHIVIDTLGNLLALSVTPANEQDRASVGELAEKV